MRRKAPPAVGDPCVRLIAVEHKHRADMAIEPLAATGELACALAVAAAFQWQRCNQHRSLQPHAGVSVVEHTAHAGHIAPRFIRIASTVVEHHAVAGAVDHMFQCIADQIVVFHRERVNGVKPAEICIRCHPALIAAVQFTAAMQVADDFGVGHRSALPISDHVKRFRRACDADISKLVLLRSWR